MQQEISEKPVVLADPKISDSAGAGSRPQMPVDGHNELAAEERAAGPRSEWPKEDTTESAPSDREPEPPEQARAPKPSRGAHPLEGNGGRGGRSPVWRPHSQAGHPLAALRPHTPPESGGHERDEIESSRPTEAPGRAQPPSGEPDVSHPRGEGSAGRSQHPFERADSSVALEAFDSSAMGGGAEAGQPVESNRPPVIPGDSESHPSDAPPEERSTEADSAIPTTPRSPEALEAEDVSHGRWKASMEQYITARYEVSGMAPRPVHEMIVREIGSSERTIRRFMDGSIPPSRLISNFVQGYGMGAPSDLDRMTAQLLEEHARRTRLPDERVTAKPTEREDGGITAPEPDEETETTDEGDQESSQRSGTQMELGMDTVQVTGRSDTSRNGVQTDDVDPQLQERPSATTEAPPRAQNGIAEVPESPEWTGSGPPRLVSIRPRQNEVELYGVKLTQRMEEWRFARGAWSDCFDLDEMYTLTGYTLRSTMLQCEILLLEEDSMTLAAAEQGRFATVVWTDLKRTDELAWRKLALSLVTEKMKRAARRERVRGVRSAILRVLTLGLAGR